MHVPVLQREVLEYLNPKSNENLIDCTIGEGGHTLAILERSGPKGKVLGIDQDPEIIKCLKPRFKHLLEDRLVLVCDNFVNLKNIVRKEKFGPVSGILFDLGMSSWHLEESKRGFSFQRDEPLDMRYNPEKQKISATDILNSWSESEIERILREYGEERFARRIAREIINFRKSKPIETTFQLVKVVRKAIPGKYRAGRRIPRRSRFATLPGRHFATRTFQALRIAVNDELENLKKVLPQASELLEPGGKLTIISFHSLEDRIVKNFLRENKALLRPLTKKPLTPSQEEIEVNPPSRSAKLRAATKLG